MALTKNEIQEIEKRASDELKDAYGNDPISPPINLGKLLKKHNLNLEEAEFDDHNALGLLDRKKKTIYVAKDEHLTRMSFTIAHELYHYLIDTTKTTDVFWRMDIIRIDIQNKKEEQKANCFAAALLMPQSLISDYWEKNIRDIKKLASIFGVSELAMSWRLKNLELVS